MGSDAGINFSAAIVSALGFFLLSSGLSLFQAISHPGYLSSGLSSLELSPLELSSPELFSLGLSSLELSSPGLFSLGLSPLELFSLGLFSLRLFFLRLFSLRLFYLRLFSPGLFVSYFLFGVKELELNSL